MPTTVYDAFASWTGDDAPYFRYRKIRDFTHAYRSKITTPSKVAERFISAIEEFSNKKPPAPLLITFDAEDVRKQAAEHKGLRKVTYLSRIKT